MQKRGVMIIVILILASVAIAQEDYNQYSSLQMNIKIYTTLDIAKKSARADIESMKAELELFPRITPEQQVISLDLKTEPTATVTKGERKIEIEWGRTDKDSINYTLESNVKTYNRIRKISQKIEFPTPTNQELKEYTQATEYIDVNEEIRDRAAEVVEGETDMYIATYKLGEWVRKNIDYDLNTLTTNAVQKSSWVLLYRKGVCDEITNLFISMARSLGIPARFVSGVVYSNLAYNFENHGWAEMYMPEHGWVPFDITFGQYGWIDPSHVKMDESVDSGEAAVTYTWKAKNAEVQSRPLRVDTEVRRKEGAVVKLAKLEARPVQQDVGFGSHMILEVAVENVQDYYLPLNFIITKSTEVMEENTGAYMVLRPREKKKFYWTLKIPDNLDDNYIYTSEIEIQSTLAEKATTKIRYGKGFRVYSKEWAERTYETLAERENKMLLPNIELNCTKDKEMYLSTEDAKITCIVHNLGNTNLNNIKVCAEEICKSISLRIAEEQKVEFEIELTKSKNLTASVETEKQMKQQTISIEVKEVPEVKIISYEPEMLGYNQLATITMELFTEAKAKDIKLEIKKLGDVEIQEMEGKYTLKVTARGKQFRKGIMDIKITYKNEKGETFVRQEKLYVTVSGLPWYAKLLNWLGF